MRQKSTLSLIEQTVMLLVFALAAVLCLQCFLWADETASELSQQDQALILAQNASEAVKASSGDLGRAAELCGGVATTDSWVILYDENWAITDDMHTYTLRVQPQETSLPYLGRASVQVLRGETSLAQLEVCWQEVNGHG